MKVLVYGFYGHQNLGDDFFVDAFTTLFPKLDFTFTDTITTELLQNADAFFIGGGSFLDQPISGYTTETAALLKTKPVCYIGIGAETNIHQQHKDTIKTARLVATRTPNHTSKLFELNPNVIAVPDLVYALKPKLSNFKIKNSLLILPNISVVPSHNNPHWMHTCWQHFKTEFAQFVDERIADGTHVRFFPFCTDTKLNDTIAIYELIGHMNKRSTAFIIDAANRTFQATTALISQFETVITARYHGAILADMCGVPSLTIHHHDKLKLDHSISYYEVSKDNLTAHWQQAKQLIKQPSSIDWHIFEQLKWKTNDALCGS